MATIHRSRDEQSGRDLALKLIHADVEPERFEREIKVLSELDDPAIVRYVGHGYADDGTPYMSMEWLEGETLAARLARGPLSIEETVGLARRILGALAVAHAAGIVHRDLKPSNLFLVGGQVGDAKLIDFGVARVLGGQAATLTRTGVALGTPAYMSPEQVRGSRLVDARADLFALGAVLHECLAGFPAFGGGDEMEVMSNVLMAEPPALAEAPPPALGRILAALLRKDPAARPASAGEVLALLDGVSCESAPAGSAPWYEARTALAAELAARCDHDGLLAVLSEAGATAVDEPARRAQLRCLAAGVLALFDLGLPDLADALVTRVAKLTLDLRLPDEESQAVGAMVSAARAASRRDLPVAVLEAAAAAAAFAAAGDGARHLELRAALAELAADSGDPARARAEADAVLAAPDASAPAQARARLALGKVAFAGKNLADARVHLKRVPAELPWLHGRALILLARAALRAGHAAVAETEARAAVAALARLPDACAGAHAVLAQALAKLKKTDEAMAACRAALAHRPAADLAELVSSATTGVMAALRGGTEI